MTSWDDGVCWICAREARGFRFDPSLKGDKGPIRAYCSRKHQEIRDMIDKTTAEEAAISNAAGMAGEFIEGMMGQGEGSDFAKWSPEAFESFIECVIDGYIAKLTELGEQHKPPF